MRIITHMVVRNEEQRYLNEVLAWADTYSDTIVLYDDQSTDKTYEYCDSTGWPTKRRPDDVPSFLEHEGQFRAAAWDWLREAADPQEDDWIFSLDADEFFVDGRGEREGLLHDIGEAEDWEADTIAFHIPEIFAYATDKDGREVLYHRTDGFWGSITGARFCRWRPGLFPDKKMASGSLPVGSKGVLESACGNILHIGYLDDDDRRDKYTRYSKLSGHNPRHVNSILQQGILERWDGAMPHHCCCDEGPCCYCQKHGGLFQGECAMHEMMAHAI